jgi:hypothetical protein
MSSSVDSASTASASLAPADAMKIPLANQENFDVMSLLLSIQIS